MLIICIIILNSQKRTFSILLIKKLNLFVFYSYKSTFIRVALLYIRT